MQRCRASLNISQMAFKRTEGRGLEGSLGHHTALKEHEHIRQQMHIPRNMARRFKIACWVYRLPQNIRK